MPLRETQMHGEGSADVRAATNAASSKSASAEAWDAMKTFVANKFTDTTAPTVIIGDAAWGPVNLSLVPGDKIEGTLEAGRANMHRVSNNQFTGELPWGSTNLEYKNGSLTGRGPWGDVSLKVDAQNIRGDLPWGKINLSLKGQDLVGPTPWGTAHLRLGANYHTLTNPDVLMALSAIVSEK